jgi:hypothetical protein
MNNRRFRYATPPVIHHVTASAARNELINKVKTKIPMIYYGFFNFLDGY